MNATEGAVKSTETPIRHRVFDPDTGLFLLLVLAAQFAASASAMDMPKALPGALLSCAHVSVPPAPAPNPGKPKPKDGSKKTVPPPPPPAPPEFLSNILSALRAQTQEYCDDTGQGSAPAALLSESNTACATGAEAPRVKTLAAAHDSRRQAFCASLNGFLQQANEFCDNYRSQEVLIRLMVGMANDPLDKDSWAALLRLKYVASITKGGVSRMQSVESQAHDSAAKADGEPGAAAALASAAQLVVDEAVSAAKDARTNLPKLLKKIDACKANKDCAKGKDLAALQSRFDQFTGAPQVCDLAAASARNSAAKAQAVVSVAKAAERGFLAAVDSAKAEELMMADQQKKVADALARLSTNPADKPQFLPPAHDKPDLTTLEKAGTVRPTFYWDAKEEDLGEPKTHAVLGPDGSTIATVSERFYIDELAMEGTGQLLDGRILNASYRINGEETFEVMGPDTPFGIGVNKHYPLVPFKTVAVDSKSIPIGSVLFIPALFGMPYIDEHDTPRLHDGIVTAVDVGKAIQNDRMDVFTGVGDQTYYYSAYGLNTMKPFDVYFVSKPAPKPQPVPAPQPQPDPQPNPTPDPDPQHPKP
jgi:3D (Asp-Asp-Asp) domain-containing protein